MRENVRRNRLGMEVSKKKSGLYKNPSVKLRGCLQLKAFFTLLVYIMSYSAVSSIRSHI